MLNCQYEKKKVGGVVSGKKKDSILKLGKLTVIVPKKRGRKNESMFIRCDFEIKIDCHPTVDTSLFGRGTD